MAIKYIQKKSTVQPITGKIVDTLNIEDKTKNTYSARVIDQMIGTGGGSNISIVYTDIITLLPEVD